MFIEKDFKDMKVQPLEGNPDYEKIFRDVPELSEYNTIPPHKKKIINYILLMYDPASPFVKRYQNINKRTSAVSDYIGLGRLKQETQNMITGYDNAELLSMVDAFVKWINDRLWGLIVVNETVFYEYQKELMEGVEGKDSKDKLQALNHKTKILQSIDEISNRLDGYYAQLYVNDKELEKAVGSQSITPEGVANGVEYA